VSPEIRADVGVGNPGQLIIQKESKAFQFDLSAQHDMKGEQGPEIRVRLIIELGSRGGRLQPDSGSANDIQELQKRD
jgi:hypothetical protein